MTDGKGAPRKAPELTPEELKLDKYEKQLEQLREKVGVPLYALLDDLEATLRQKDLPELGILDPKEQDKYVKPIMERTSEYIEELKLKENRIEEARQPVNDFVNNLENLTGLTKIIESKNPKKAAKGWWEKIKKTLITIPILGPLIAKGLVDSLYNWADELKGDKKHDTILSGIIRKFADLFGGKEKEKGKKKGEVAKKEKPEEKPTETAEVKYKDRIKEIEDVFEPALVKVKKIDEQKYKEMLKNYGDDHKKLMSDLRGSLKRDGTMRHLNNMISTQKQLKDKPVLELKDLLLTGEQARDIGNAIGGLESVYQIPDLENLTPEKCRKFIEAVRTGIGIEAYEKPAKRVASAKPPKREGGYF